MSNPPPRNERFFCAVRTLEVMIAAKCWVEACLILAKEIDRFNDPQPPGIEGGWTKVYFCLIQAKDGRK